MQIEAGSVKIERKMRNMKNIFNRDFVVSTIIPIIIFYIFNKFKMSLTGIIVSGIWSLTIICISFFKTKKLNAMAAITMFFSAIGLLGTIISKNPIFYFLYPIVTSLLVSLIFFLSLFSKRSLIQVIVEESYLKNSPRQTRNDKKHKFIWRLLTVVWGISNMIQAVVGVVLLKTISMSSYYTLITLFSNISIPILIIFSITFSKWYFKPKISAKI